jgi:hypothetical protein
MVSPRYEPEEDRAVGTADFRPVVAEKEQIAPGWCPAGFKVRP